MIKPPARRSPRESHARPGPAAALTGSATAGRPDSRTHGRQTRTDRHSRTDPDAPSPQPADAARTAGPKLTGPRRRSPARIGCHRIGCHRTPRPQGKTRTRPGPPPSPPPLSTQVRTRTDRTRKEPGRSYPQPAAEVIHRKGRSYPHGPGSLKKAPISASAVLGIYIH